MIFLYELSGAEIKSPPHHLITQADLIHIYLSYLIYLKLLQ